MELIFLKLLNMSISASFLVLAVVILRFLFQKRIPKWINVCLWGIVAIRLAVPFSLESRFSMLPKTEFLTVEATDGQSPVLENDADETGTHSGAENTMQDNTVQAAVSAQKPGIIAGTVMGNQTAEVTENEKEPTQSSPVNGGTIAVQTPQDSMAQKDTKQNGKVDWQETAVTVITYVWLNGVLGLLLYTMLSYVRLKKSVVAAIPRKDERWAGVKVYQCETVKSPFVLGIAAPKIYLPFSIEEQDVVSIIEHEKAHMERRDYWWKPLGFLLLTLHWFNPFIWTAYVLFCRDIELACDEKVVRAYSKEQRVAYSQALLNCNVDRRRIAACPLAFGEIGVKERVKNVLHYKKPAFWMICVALLSCVLFAACFLTDPVTTPEPEEKKNSTLPTPAGLTDIPEPTEGALPTIPVTMTPVVTEAPEVTQEPEIVIEQGELGTLGDIVYHLELMFLQDKMYRREIIAMDANLQEELLAEYGTLLEDYVFICRQSVDGSYAFIVGQYAGEDGGDELAGYHKISQDDDLWLYDNKYEDAIWDSASGIKLEDVAVKITKSTFYFTEQQGTIYIEAKNSVGSLWGGMYQYFHKDRGPEYIRSAVSRGVLMDIPADGPYLQVYMISEDYGELAETIPLTETEATIILAQERGKLAAGYGFSAAMTWNGKTEYFTEFRGVPDKVLELAVERCGYRFCSPEHITDKVVAATLECDWLETPVCHAAEEDLERLTEILKNAEFGFMGACGYGAKLTITMENGETVIAYKGTDGCDSIAFGSYGGYFLGNKENIEFWNIFGLDEYKHKPLQ